MQAISSRFPARLKVHGYLTCVAAFALVASCSILPTGEGFTQGPWQSYQEAQETFDRIIPHQTTLEELRKLKLDPHANPNITILNYSDVIRRFIPSHSINTSDLDAGVLECIMAKSACQGYEIDYRSIKRNRYGNVVLDFLSFDRKVDIVGWRFQAVILIKNNVVIYKLTGGQPAIHEHEEHVNPLGPLQGSGESGSLGR